MSMTSLNPGLIFPDDLEGPRGTGSGDNELILWRAIKALRSSLAGPGSPLVAFFGDGSPNGTNFIGNLANNGCAIGQVLVLGQQFQITTGAKILTIDSINQRVGINTCAPAYTLDIYSNECGSNVLGMRNGKDTLDIDSFPNFLATPTGRIRTQRVTFPTGTRMEFFTGDSTDTLSEHMRIDEIGNLSSFHGFVMTGILSPAQITSNQTDYNPTGLASASHLRLSTDASRTIFTLLTGVAGRVLVITNIGTQNLVLSQDDGVTGVATARFLLPNGINLTMKAADSVTLYYDGTSSRWRVSGSGLITQFSGTGEIGRASCRERV